MSAPRAGWLQALWGGPAHAIALGLLGAGVVHIVILLLMPGFSERNAWGRLADVAGLNELVQLDGGLGGVPLIAAGDPSFVSAACRFSLAEGMLHVTAPGRIPFWSASIYDRAGTNLFSLTDRSAAERLLDLVVLTPEQMIGVRQAMPEELQQSLFLEVPASEGIFVIRAFVPDATWAATLESFYRGAACRLR